MGINSLILFIMRLLKVFECKHKLFFADSYRHEMLWLELTSSYHLVQSQCTRSWARAGFPELCPDRSWIHSNMERALPDFSHSVKKRCLLFLHKLTPLCKEVCKSVMERQWNMLTFLVPQHATMWLWDILKTVICRLIILPFF